MKIVFLSRYQNGPQRGAETFVLELSNRLSKWHDVSVLSGSDSDDLSKIIKGGYDVVIPINGRLQSLKVSLGRLFGGYKILISGHSGIGRDDIWNIVIGRPDTFVALTEQMFRWARKWAWGVKVSKIPNGIDLTKFRPDGPKLKIDLPAPIILCVGALTWSKYHDRAIKAVAELETGSLLIVGKGEKAAELDKLGRSLFPGRFMITSFPYQDLPSVYRSVDLFTLPSWDREAFGIVYLEAMASGLGVVAPNDLARSEIIGKAGVLTDVSDEKRYSEAIKLALDKNWKDVALEQASKFTWDKVAKMYDEAIRKL